MDWTPSVPPRTSISIDCTTRTCPASLIPWTVHRAPHRLLHRLKSACVCMRYGRSRVCIFSGASGNSASATCARTTRLAMRSSAGMSVLGAGVKGEG
eukprot:1198182-Rhodomonas_salina.3